VLSGHVVRATNLEERLGSLGFPGIHAEDGGAGDTVPSG
jgi:hypothetical protein